VAVEVRSQCLAAGWGQTKTHLNFHKKCSLVTLSTFGSDNMTNLAMAAEQFDYGGDLADTSLAQQVRTGTGHRLVSAVAIRRISKADRQEQALQTPRARAKCQPIIFWSEGRLFLDFHCVTHYLALNLNPSHVTPPWNAGRGFITAHVCA
jgi:hypothetical protein